MISKKFLLPLLAFLVLAVPATVVYAGDACDPGCDCPQDDTTGEYGGVLGAMQNYAEVVRVRTKAEAQEVIKQPENALGVTCFDRALAVTVKLGSIFSDKFPEADSQTGEIDIPPPNLSAFPGVSYINAGADKMLSTALSDTVSKTMENYVKNFDQSLSAYLGATNLQFMSANPDPGENSFANDISGSILGTWGAINEPVDEIQDTVDEITEAWDAAYGYVQAYDTATDWLQKLPLLGSIIGTAVDWLDQYLGPILDILEVIGSVMDIVSGVSDTIDQYQSTFSSYIGSVINLLGVNIPTFNPQTAQPGLDDCSRMSQLWSNVETGFPGFKPMVGGGITGVDPGDDPAEETGMPYLSVNDIISEEFLDGSGDINVNTIAGYLPDFAQAFTNDNDPDAQSTVISRAIAALGPDGVFGAPENTTSAIRKMVPPINAQVVPFAAAAPSTQNLIDAMMLPE